MALVDFYILNKPSASDRHHFACRLVEKIVKQGNRVFIATASADETNILDHKLWHFRPDAFVPHTQSGASADPLAPVLISHTDEDQGARDVLVNLRL